MSAGHQPIAGSRDPEVPEQANDDIALSGEWPLIVVADELPDPLEPGIELQRRDQTFTTMHPHHNRVSRRDRGSELGDAVVQLAAPRPKIGLRTRQRQMVIAQPHPLDAPRRSRVVELVVPPSRRR